MDAATKWFDKAAGIARETRNISATREMPSRLHYMAGDNGCLPWQIEATETAVGLIQFGLLQTADCTPPRSDDKPAQITLNAWVQSGIMAEAQNHDVWAWYQYKKAAEAGHPVAQNNFADFYRAGRGLPQDGALARQWFRRAAEQGYAKAQNNLAVLYQTGAGGEKDEKAAQGWYEKAARQGFTLAQGNLGTLYAQKADERMAQLQRDEDTLGHLFSRPDNQLKTALAQEIATINRNYASRATGWKKPPHSRTASPPTTSPASTRGGAATHATSPKRAATTSRRWHKASKKHELPCSSWMCWQAAKNRISRS